jgi:hypothetical protein
MILKRRGRFDRRGKIYFRPEPPKDPLLEAMAWVNKMIKADEYLRHLGIVKEHASE